MSNMQVTVPSGTEPELAAFVADLWSRTAPAPGREATAANGAATAGRPTRILSVREMYEGGTSVRWRPFLQYFAHRPDQWVKMAEGFEAVGFTVPQGIGLVGAAERRCGSYSLPNLYQKRWGPDGKAEVWMSSEVAQEILELGAGEA